MKLFRSILYRILPFLTGLMALSAIGGGIALLFNLYAPPVAMLSRSIFSDYTVPGLSLLLLVGGSAVFAMVLLIRNSRYALLFSTTSGIVMLFFEFVEVVVIGSPVGPALVMQLFYAGLGTLITVFALGVWFLDIGSQQG